jgi:AraC family transcriptional regulator, transcriptional activator of pobA
MANLLVDAGNNDLSFRLLSFEDDLGFHHFQRLNCYSIILLLEGTGRLFVDHSEYDIEHGGVMISFSPYQAFKIISKEQIKGYFLNFHSDFLCVYKHHKEIACNGVLFDNIYGSPLLPLEQKDMEQFCSIIEQMISELHRTELAQNESLVSYLKIFLINAARMKMKIHPQIEKKLADSTTPLTVQKLKEAIELHYRTKHSARDYADLLYISGKALAKITRDYLHRTPTDLISERIIIEAKRDLYLTNKTIKEIAHSLGYVDEFYFSRFFKANTDVSPQVYRETVGFGKGDIQ